MKDSYPDIQADSLEMASEPIVVYGDSITSSTERIPSISVREQILAKTVSVDKYFDELISQVRHDSLCQQHAC